MYKPIFQYYNLDLPFFHKLEICFSFQIYSEDYHWSNSASPFLELIGKWQQSHDRSPKTHVYDHTQFAVLRCVTIKVLRTAFIIRNIWGVPSWFSKLGIWCCEKCGSGYSCGVGSTPGLGTSVCHRCGQKKKKKKKATKELCGKRIKDLIKKLRGLLKTEQFKEGYNTLWLVVINSINSTRLQGKNQAYEKTKNQASFTIQIYSAPELGELESSKFIH